MQLFLMAKEAIVAAFFVFASSATPYDADVSATTAAKAEQDLSRAGTKMLLHCI